MNRPRTYLSFYFPIRLVLAILAILVILVILVISAKFSGVELYKIGKGWSVKLPENLVEAHEAHFARVPNNFLAYLKNLPAGRQSNNVPAWEVPNMPAKYYTTTKALETALKKK